MKTPEHLVQLIEAGKQVGKRLSLDRDGEPAYVSLAIQKLGNSYWAYYFEIPEKQIISDEPAREEKLCFDRLEDALSFLSEASGMDIDDLAPLKGTKVFDAESP